jgi:CBS domain-containing protein
MALGGVASTLVLADAVRKDGARRRIDMRIKDVMTTDVVTVGPHDSLKQVATTLAARGISGVPVVGEDGSLLGVVSEADILFKERGPAERHGLLGWLLEPDAPQKLEARTAEQAMTSPARTIGPERPVSEAAGRMLEEGINRLPVVDDEGKLLGIVTRADLVRAFVRSDADIERELREDVVLRTLWIAPEGLSITVENGNVKLGGQVETKNDAELVEAFARRVPGTVSVDSHLTWEVENGHKR